MNRQETQSVPMRRETNWPIWTPLIAAILASLLIRGFDLDRRISSLNYDSVNHVWPFERAEPWLSFYRYATYPPLLLGVGGLIVFVFAGLFWPSLDALRLNRLRQNGLFLGLLLAIGPGLLVNGGLKSLWGRPRPLQCIDFDGAMTFCQVGEFSGETFPNSSFPSGHASIAFFVMGPAFLIDRNQRRLRNLWLFGGIAFGIAMGATRVLQGGHFVSDVLWAGMIVYLVGAILARIMFRDGNRYSAGAGKLPISPESKAAA